MNAWQSPRGLSGRPLPPSQKEQDRKYRAAQESIRNKYQHERSSSIRSYRKAEHGRGWFHEQKEKVREGWERAHGLTGQNRLRPGDPGYDKMRKMADKKIKREFTKLDRDYDRMKREDLKYLAKNRDEQYGMARENPEAFLKDNKRRRKGLLGYILPFFD